MDESLGILGRAESKIFLLSTPPDKFLDPFDISFNWNKKLLPVD
jgi:hypothetical protein